VFGSASASRRVGHHHHGLFFHCLARKAGDGLRANRVRGQSGAGHFPAGLFLSNHWSWHVSFGAIIILSIAAMAAGGMADAAGERPSDKAQTGQDRVSALIATVAQTRYDRVSRVTTLLATGGYVLMPFGSAYLREQISASTSPSADRLSRSRAAIRYFHGPYASRRASVRSEKFPMFAFGSASVSIIMVLICTSRSGR
jgi:predicted MFS family arabinose efflux permease